MTKREIQDYVYKFLKNEGLPTNTACAILGNINGENGPWKTTYEEVGSGIGYGLCQWSFGRRTQLHQYVSSQSGKKSELECQCIFLWNELTGKATKAGDKAEDFSLQWIANPSPAVDNDTGFYCSLETFLKGEGDLSFLADAFRFCWERPAYKYSGSWGCVVNRRKYAVEFYERYYGVVVSDFTKRLEGDKPVPSNWPLSEPENTYYGTGNPYHSVGLGMFSTSGKAQGNCTAYAWGRAWEILTEALGGSRDNPTPSTKPNIGTQGDACKWFSNIKAGGAYVVDSTPKIGDIVCWKDSSSSNPDEYGGHVAVVEDVLSNGDIVTSNSGWDYEGNGRYFFYDETIKKSDNYNNGSYKFQGFVHILGDLELSPSGVYIQNEFHVPYIYYESKWCKAVPCIFNGTEWVRCTKQDTPSQV